MPLTLSTWSYPYYSSSFHYASNMSLTLTQCLSVCPVSYVQSVTAPAAGSSERGVALLYTPSTPGDSPVLSPPLLQSWTSCVCHRPHWNLIWASTPAGSQVMWLKCINIMTLFAGKRQGVLRNRMELEIRTERVAEIHVLWHFLVKVKQCHYRPGVAQRVPES
jgi:hypothetical protein